MRGTVMAVSYRTLPKMKVADVMTKQVDYVRPTDKVEKAALLIFGKNISVPVCEGKKLVGIVTEDDVLKHFYPKASDLMEAKSLDGNFSLLQEKAATIMSIPVSKIMSKRPVTVRDDAPLTKAQALMHEKGVGSLPVIDEDNRLVGLVSKGDVFRSLIGEKVQFLENEDYNDFLSNTYYSTVDWENRLKYELPDLLKLFKEHNVKTVLDVGCGTGEHSIELAKHGFSVIGNDRSMSMIAEANRNKIDLSSDKYSNVHFWHKDTEDLLYDLDLKFDAIMIMGNTLSHNPENYRHLIKKCIDCLSENGILIIQVTNFEKVLKTDKRLLNFSFVPTNEEPLQEFSFLEFYDNPIRDKTILKTFAILASDGKRWKVAGIRNTLMAYTNEARIKTLLKNEGLAKIKTFGGSFDGRHWDYLFRKPFKALESDWLNIVATRK